MANKDILSTITGLLPFLVVLVVLYYLLDKFGGASPPAPIDPSNPCPYGTECARSACGTGGIGGYFRDCPVGYTWGGLLDDNCRCQGAR